jgi:hypothetical protein
MHFSLLVLATFIAAADDAKTARYGIAPDLAAYPQGTPQEALASVVKAIEAKRFDYLVAQLADPVYVDDRIQRLHGGRFDDQVEDTRNRLDAAALMLLRRFSKDGAWQAEKQHAIVMLKDVSDNVVSFRLIAGRWFLEHRNK